MLHLTSHHHGRGHGEERPGWDHDLLPTGRPAFDPSVLTAAELLEAETETETDRAHDRDPGPRAA